jgi:N-acyl-D-amino-acid deacylase
MILADGRHEPKVRQGVTTELVGVDGNGFAPFERRADLEAFVDLDAGLDGRPDIDYDWTSVASYLARYDGTVSLNVASLIGNSQLRIAALGWDDVPADERAIDGMRGALRDGMADGAFGLSSGLDYPPGAYATTAELAALTGEAGRQGGFYHTHVRYPLGDRYLDPFREAIEIGRRAGAPAHITHFYHRETHPGGPEPMLALIDDARVEGLDVTFDTYPSEWASTRLLIQLPQWIQAGGPGPLKQRLADRAARDRVRAEFAARGASYASKAGWADVRLGAFHRPENLRWESRTVADVMAETGHDALDVICDLLLAEDLGVSQVTSGPWAQTLPLFVVHPIGMVGTDSTFLGAKPSPRTYGSFPRILGQFVRDEALLSLEEAVRKMTSAPAARLGLRDRGIIRDGMIADLVVFDPATVRSTATYDEPRSYPVGIEQVIVAGTLVVADGVHTGATPGRALRLGRD